MAGNTSEEVLKGRLEFDGKQPEQLIKSLMKLLKDLDKKSENIKLGIDKKDLADIENAKQHLKTLKTALKEIKKVGDSPLSFKRETAQVKHLAENFSYVLNNLKGINRELAAMKMSLTGKNALTYKAWTQGQRDFLNYGTEIGQKKNYYKTQELARNNARYVWEKENPAAAQATKAQEDLNRSLYRATNILPIYQLHIMANYAAINKLVSGYKYLLNYTVQYDEELHQLQAISGMTSASLDNVRKTIEAVAASTEFTSLEIAKASTVLAQAGLSASQIQRTLPAIAKLATATGTDLATSTDVITSTVNVYNMQMSEAEYVTNALTTAMNESKATIAQFQTGLQYAGNIAAQLGVSFDETAAAISAMTQAGVRSKSTLGTGLRAIFTEFSKPSKALITQLNRVGLTLEDVDIRTNGFTNVLKTLKDAGFGVTEALKGMQRRSATALVSLMSQVDFMDELRLKMAGSTAATEANTTQMEALAKQIRNFKNVISNAATQGLEPFIRLLSDLLAILNKIMNSSAGKFLISTLLTGGTVFGGLKAVQLGLGALLTGFTGISGAMKTIGASKAIAFFNMIIKGQTQIKGAAAALKLFSLSIGGLTKFSIIITLLYQAGKALGLFTSEADKAKAKLDELNGKVEELETTGEIINSFQERLIRERKKLSSSTEQNIFIREILTRIPEANKLLNTTSSTLDDVKRALEELNRINLDNIIAELEKTAEAAEKATSAGAIKDAHRLWGGQRWYERLFGPSNEDAKNYFKGYKRFQSLFPTMLKMDPLMYSDSSGYRHYYGNYSGSDFYNNPSKYLQNFKYYADDRQAEIISKNIKDAINEGFKSRNDLTNAQKATMLESLRADKDINFFAGDSLKEIANYFRTLAKLEEKQASSGILSAGFNKVIDELVTKSTKVVDSIDNTIKVNEAYFKYDKNSESYNNAVQQLTDQLKELTSSRDSLNKLNKAETLEDVRTALGLSPEEMAQKIATIQEKVGKTFDEKALVDAIKNTEEFRDGSKAQLEISDKINTVIDKLTMLGLAIPSGTLQDPGAYVEANKSLDKQIKAAKKAGNIKEARFLQSQKIANIREQYAAENYQTTESLKKEGKSSEEILDIQNRISQERDKAIEGANTSFNKLIKTTSTSGPKFDAAAEKLNKFFKDLDADIAKIETTYINAEKVLDSVLAKQKGTISGAGLYFGKNNAIVTYEQNRLQDIENSQIPFRLANLQAKRSSLGNALDMLRGNAGYKDVTERYKAAEARYDAAISGGRWSEAEAARRIMNTLGSANKKYTEEEKKLSQDLAKLDESITELDTTIKSRNAYAGMGVGDSLKYGFKAAAGNYMYGVREQGLDTLGGSMAYLSTQAIDSFDSSMTTMFQNIADGSQRAGDAFKDFGKSVIKTLRDVAIQMAVKQGLNLLFSAFGGGSGAVDAQGNPVDISFATGGLINGPVKNRDSVPTMLMPGEYVLKKSAVDTIGRDYLDNLNANASATMEAADQYISSSRSDTVKDNTGAGGTVNVYVVGQEQQQSMTPNDVIVTISQDMLKGGQTKKLVKSIAMGSI